jgi:hypothetical protein
MGEELVESKEEEEEEKDSNSDFLEMLLMISMISGGGGIFGNQGIFSSFLNPVSLERQDHDDDIINESGATSFVQVAPNTYADPTQPWQLTTPEDLKNSGFQG